MKAAQLLTSNLGYEISKPLGVEVYDLIARNPKNGDIYRIQVKTVFRRKERNGAIVIQARKGDGSPYMPEEVDIIVGVEEDKAYMVECRGITEYWATEANVSEKWTILQ